MAPPTRRPSDPRNPNPGIAQVVVLQPASMDDRSLVHGLKEGDQAALCQFYDRFATMIRGLLLRVMGHAQGVDDLVHDVFLTVVRRSGEIRKPESLRAFVHGVAVRSAKDELRRRKLRGWIGLSDTSSAELPTRFQEPGKREAISHVYEALNRLSVDCRLAFALRHIEGMELAEAADACDWSLSTFKRKLIRAERQFDALAMNDPVLRAVMAERKGRS